MSKPTSSSWCRNIYTRLPVNTAPPRAPLPRGTFNRAKAIWNRYNSVQICSVSEWFHNLYDFNYLQIYEQLFKNKVSMSSWVKSRPLHFRNLLNQYSVNIVLIYELKINSWNQYWLINKIWKKDSLVYNRWRMQRTLD